MSNVKGFIVGTTAERDRLLEVAGDDASILVLPFPLFAPDPEKYITGKSRSKSNQIPDSELTLKSFEFRYREQLEEFLSSCDSIVMLAPKTPDGLVWSSHAYRMGRTMFGRDPLPFACHAYTYLCQEATRGMDQTRIDKLDLEVAFHRYVYEYIVNIWFRNYVTSPFHAKLARSGKGAPSFGGVSTLAAVVMLENRHYAEIQALFTDSAAMSRQLFPVPMHCLDNDNGKGVTIAPVYPEIVEHGISLVGVDPVPNVLLPNPSDLAEAASPSYVDIWCFTQGMQASFDQYLRRGVIALPDGSACYAEQLSRAVRDSRALVSSYGVVLNEDALTQANVVAALNPVSNIPLVTSRPVSEDFDPVYEHIREQMFLAYYRPSPRRELLKVYVHALPDGQPSDSVNDGYAIASQAVDVDDYFALIGTLRLTTGPLTTAPPKLVNSASPYWLEQLVSLLQASNFRPSYALICLRNLCKRKMLDQFGKRVEPTSYGFAYHTLFSAFIEKMSVSWHEHYNTAMNNIGIAAPNYANTLAEELTKAFDVLHPMRALAAKIELPKRRLKKAGTDKKTTWTLQFDHKEHVAYWSTKSGKRRSVWYKVTGTEATDVATGVDVELDIFPKASKKLIVIPRTCPECGALASRLHEDSKDSGRLSATCVKCGTTARHNTVTIIKEC